MEPAPALALGASATCGFEARGRLGKPQEDTTGLDGEPLGTFVAKLDPVRREPNRGLQPGSGARDTARPRGAQGVD